MNVSIAIVLEGGHELAQSKPIRVHLWSMLHTMDPKSASDILTCARNSF